jgi:DNA-binding transcriptional ArsR family regulator
MLLRDGDFAVPELLRRFLDCSHFTPRPDNAQRSRCHWSDKADANFITNWRARFAAYYVSQYVNQNRHRLTIAYSNISIFYITTMPETLRQFKADIFQALAHPTRIAILELLSQGELSAGALIEKLGMEQANISQHLAVLRTKRLVANRKAGNQVFYSVRDPLIIEVLNLMRTYFHTHLQESMEMLEEMKKPLETT